jgi:drug/metabolite transporter (DMT)-like permease
LVIASYRLSLASLFYIALGRVRSLRPQQRVAAPKMRWALYSGLFLSLHFIAWISSLQYTSVASSVVLVQTAPVLVAIGSYFFLQEKGSGLLFSGIGLSLAGSLLISYFDFQGQSASLKGNLLALAGAAGAAGYLIFGRRLRQELDTISYVRLVYSAAALATVAMALSTGQAFFGYSTSTYILLFLLALFPQVIGHTSLNWALKHFSATSVSIMTLAEPIGASILAYWILHEQISGMKILGGSIILLGIALTVLSESKAD